MPVMQRDELDRHIVDPDLVDDLKHRPSNIAVEPSEGIVLAGKGTPCGLVVRCCMLRRMDKVRSK